MAVALYYAKVVYNANGGSGVPAAQTGGTEISGGSVLITLSSSKPSRQYYTFNGWAYSSGASSGMSGGTTISCNASTTLYVANARVTSSMQRGSLKPLSSHTTLTEEAEHPPHRPSIRTLGSHFEPEFRPEAVMNS